MNKFRAAAIQMPTVEDKMENIKAVRHYLEQIKAQKVDFVVLPEMFCCPYQTEKFPEYAEEEGGSVWKALSAYAISLAVQSSSAAYRITSILNAFGSSGS